MTAQSKFGSYLPLAAGGVLLLVIIIAVVAIVRSGESLPDLNDPEVRRELAEAHEAADFYISSDQLPEARVILDKLLDRYPHDAHGHILMTKLLMAEGEVRAAYQHADRSVSLDDAQHEAQFLTALLAEANGEFEKAREHYARATELAPEVAGYAMYLAQSLLRLERIEEAEVQLARAERLDATLHQTFAMQGEIAARRGEIETALEQVDKALDLVDRQERRHFINYTLQKAELLRRAGNAEAAQAVLLSLPPASQQEQRVVEQLAEGYMMLDRPDRAAAVWAELSALEPDNPRAAAEAGMAFLQAQQYEHAERYHDLARSISSSDRAVLALEEALQSAN